MIKKNFWLGKRVFITGHTGFKGSWLCLLLTQWGATVKGYALAPPTTPSLFNEANIDQSIDSEIGDIRDLEALTRSISQFKPDILFHLAAQPIVRDSYLDPITTYSTNIMGTINVFEAVRKITSIKAVVNITSDKCYENKETLDGYAETSPMGGHDPYSCSKGCSELVTASYQQSFFPKKDYLTHRCAIATARAGNVIGGGDWAKDRLIPDMLSAFSQNKSVEIRSPQSIRPWQHVLEPLSGYLLLAEKLFTHGTAFNGAWNFGPTSYDEKPVYWIVEKLAKYWGDGSKWHITPTQGHHEAQYLKLDCSKALNHLSWQPKWNLDQSLQRIVHWQKNYLSKKNTKETCLAEINEYLKIRD